MDSGFRKGGGNGPIDLSDIMGGIVWSLFLDLDY